MACLPTTLQIFFLISRRAIRFVLQWISSYIHVSAIIRTYDIIIPLLIKWIKYLGKTAFNLEFGKKILFIYQIWAILSGKNGKKNDCLTSYYFKEQIHPNFGNTVKILAPITSVPATMTLFPWSDLPNIWSLCFCLHNRKRNEQRRYSEA